MKNQLSSREKRTIRIAATLIGLYLVVFYGSQLLGSLREARRKQAELEGEISRLEGAIRLEGDPKARVFACMNQLII